MKEESEIFKQDATIRVEDNIIYVALQCDYGDGLKWYSGIIYDKKETAINLKKRLLSNGFKSVVISGKKNE